MNEVRLTVECQATEKMRDTYVSKNGVAYSISSPPCANKGIRRNSRFRGAGGRDCAYRTCVVAYDFGARSVRTPDVIFCFGVIWREATALRLS